MTKKTETQTETKAPKFTVKKRLTLPLLKPQIDVPVFVKIMEPLKVGKKVDKQKAEAIIANVVNLETGEEAQFLVPAVIQGILHDEYGAPLYGQESPTDPVHIIEEAHKDQEPNNYVGKCFQVIKHAKASGKQYNPYTLAEVEVE